LKNLPLIIDNPGLFAGFRDLIIFWKSLKGNSFVISPVFVWFVLAYDLHFSAISSNETLQRFQSKPIGGCLSPNIAFQVLSQTSHVI